MGVGRMVKAPNISNTILTTLEARLILGLEEISR